MGRRIGNIKGVSDNVVFWHKIILKKEKDFIILHNENIVQNQQKTVMSPVPIFIIIPIFLLIFIISLLCDL